ncbi:MAG: M48 family metallopeptidase [Bacteroidales bacterium]|nr:M48 family metallopeptidase [Bacteroidales bacterium]
MASSEAQQFIEKCLLKHLRKLAVAYLPKRLQLLADRHGLTYMGLRLKNMKTRWGSCSAKNNINLNIHLMRLPVGLADYVMLHELMHTREKNHGPRFWASLSTLLPNARAIDKELKRFSSQHWHFQ